MGGGRPAWHDGCRACGCDGVERALTVIAFVGYNMARLQPVKQRLDLGDVVALAAGQDEADRIAKRVGGGMDLGAQAAFRPSQRVSLKPVFGLIAFFGAPALC